MHERLWLIPALPLAGFVVLALAGYRMPRRAVGVIAVTAVALSAAVAVAAAVSFIAAAPEGHAWTQTVWRWFTVGGFAPTIGLHLDALSLVMTVVVAGVALLIHVYATASMETDEGYARFFAYMNLFVASMLTLLLADNLLLLYLGWEGVGLCSYLLIGHWYQDPANGRAAQKAFIVTRVGDVALAVAIFLLYTRLGTLDLAEIGRRAAQSWTRGDGVALAAALLLLGGAVGKSAQLPLQTWLPDAMAGPTPVSALIHAATMVTAGVYLVARMHVIFELAPSARIVLAVIGAATLLLAAVSALCQRDIKRVLAYSTMSQVGYMFLALGVGAWSAAILHFLTHAFFKSLLFLSAGVVIDALGHEHDIYEMGGLRRALPTAFWTFLVAGASLAGVPIVTAGFYSKDWILSQAWSAGPGGPVLWAVGLAGALLTSIYVFRVVFLVFFGAERRRPTVDGRARIQAPLVILGLLSVVGGLLEVPPTLGHVPLFSTFLETTLPPGRHVGVGLDAALGLAAAVAAFGGIAIAWALYLRYPAVLAALARPPLAARLASFWAGGWGFDAIYDRLFVRPYVWLAHAGRNDVLDRPFRAIASAARGLNHVLSRTENGNLRWYAMGLAGGTAVIVALVLLA